MERLTRANRFSERVKERLDAMGASVKSRQVKAILEELDLMVAQFDQLYEDFHRAQYLSKKK